jgi:hypothetical protein
MPLARATSRFCGFPMGVAALPMVTEKAKVRRSGLDEIFIFFASEIMIGVPMSASVSFIRNALAAANPKKVRYKTSSGLLALNSSLVAKASKTPAISNAVTRVNILKRNKIT